MTAVLDGSGPTHPENPRPTGPPRPPRAEMPRPPGTPPRPNPNPSSPPPPKAETSDGGGNVKGAGCGRWLAPLARLLPHRSAVAAPGGAEHAGHGPGPDGYRTGATTTAAGGSSSSPVDGRPEVRISLRAGVPARQPDRLPFGPADG